MRLERFPNDDTNANARPGTSSRSCTDASTGADAAADAEYEFHGNVAGEPRLRVMFGGRGVWFQHV